MAAPEGNSNNATGTAFKDALRYEIAKLGRAIRDADPSQSKDTAIHIGMRAIAAPLVEKAAIDKDLGAIREVADRVDGKAGQSLQLDADIKANVSGKVTFVRSSRD